MFNVCLQTLPEFPEYILMAPTSFISGTDNKMHCIHMCTASFELRFKQLVLQLSTHTLRYIPTAKSIEGKEGGMQPQTPRHKAERSLVEADDG